MELGLVEWLDVYMGELMKLCYRRHPGIYWINRGQSRNGKTHLPKQDESIWLTIAHSQYRRFMWTRSWTSRIAFTGTDLWNMNLWDESWQTRREL